MLNKINSISFGSTYKVKTSTKIASQTVAFHKFEDYCLKKASTNHNFQTKYEVEAQKEPPYREACVRTLIVPQYLDGDVEAYCKQNGIRFEKTFAHELLNCNAVSKRIEKAPEGFIKVNIEPYKLLELTETQKGNIKYCKNDYYNFFDDEIEFAILSGDEFPTTTLRIEADKISNKELQEHLEAFGKNSLDEDMIRIDFVRKRAFPDIGVFFALRNIGMDKVPVYMDKNTFMIASALDLIKM